MNLYLQNLFCDGKSLQQRCPEHGLPPTNTPVSSCALGWKQSSGQRGVLAPSTPSPALSSPVPWLAVPWAGEDKAFTSTKHPWLSGSRYSGPQQRCLQGMSRANCSNTDGEPMDVTTSVQPPATTSRKDGGSMSRSASQNDTKS